MTGLLAVGIHGLSELLRQRFDKNQKNQVMG